MDIKECSTEESKCVANSLCIETIGSYECQSKDGFSQGSKSHFFSDFLIKKKRLFAIDYNKKFDPIWNPALSGSSDGISGACEENKNELDLAIAFTMLGSPWNSDYLTPTSNLHQALADQTKSLLKPIIRSHPQFTWNKEKIEFSETASYTRMTAAVLLGTQISDKVIIV